MRAIKFRIRIGAKVRCRLSSYGPTLPSCANWQICWMQNWAHSSPRKNLTMPDINEVFGGETLKAADLQGREFTLAIASVQAKQFDKGNKLVIKFVGAKKALIANRTNGKRIAML